MAVIEYSLACHCGTPLTQPAGKGRKRKYCSARCKYLGKWRTWVQRHPDGRKKGERTFSCATCGNPFVAAHKRKYCSAECVGGFCQDCGVPVSKTKRCEACYRAEQFKVSPNRFTCEQCGKEARRSPGGQNIKNGSRNRWCSMRCKVAWSAARKPEPAPFSVVHFNTCKQCGRLWTVRRSKSLCSRECELAYGRERARAIISERVCKWCEKIYVPCFTGGMLGRFCCEACRKASAAENGRIAMRKQRKTYGGGGYRSRARKAGVAYEPINRTKVFERDGWRCQICAKATPRSRQGYRYSNSPELDHCVPFALGGPHLYSNVQCACRACNAIKGGHTVAGQLSIFNQ